ncbi:VQ motif-containing protein 8, chloroplastic [Euphorbia lathyris]|uniref:VQ motif-containing protein 8, chloroplastic n=1 Tax=Euphorbia lathyris TaxID=212925 RepID=UPI0033133191
MSPAPKFQQTAMNGPRPSPLKLNKESHLIHKSSKQKNPPVIIYTQSPKVIHTPATDFMALVQRLTGISSSCTQKGKDDEKPSDLENFDINQKPICLADFPLFTPTSMDLFCSPKPNLNLYRYCDSELMKDT